MQDSRSCLCTRRSVRALTWPWRLALPQVPLSLQLLPTDPVGLVPMKLGSPDSSVRQADRSDPLHFAPATRPIHLAKARQFPNRATSRDGLETRDLADDLEARDRHRWLFSITSRRTLTTWR